MGIIVNTFLKTIQPDYYSFYTYLFQRKEFVKYAKVFPLAETLDFKVPSKWYRRTVGILEITCGMAMAFVPSRKYQIILHFYFDRLLQHRVSHFISICIPTCFRLIVVTFPNLCH